MIDLLVKQPQRGSNMKWSTSKTIFWIFSLSINVHVLKTNGKQMLAYLELPDSTFYDKFISKTAKKRQQYEVGYIQDYFLGFFENKW